MLLCETQNLVGITTGGTSIRSISYKVHKRIPLYDSTHSSRPMFVLVSYQPHRSQRPRTRFPIWSLAQTRERTPPIVSARWATQRRFSRASLWRRAGRSRQSNSAQDRIPARETRGQETLVRPGRSSELTDTGFDGALVPVASIFSDPRPVRVRF